MFLHHIDLTPALRPELRLDESLLSVQDGVGLYQQTSKIPNYQNGQVYLTSHRLCYVDKEQPRKRAIALYLKDIDRIEFYAGFFKSSAKITIVPLPTSNPTIVSAHTSQTSLTSQTISETPTSVPSSSSITWICRICSHVNPLPSNFDPLISSARQSKPPPCKACGMTPDIVDLVKVALASKRQPSSSSSTPLSSIDSGFVAQVRGTSSIIVCARCTFENDSALAECEVCGARLPTRDNLRKDVTQSVTDDSGRTSSPEPSLATLSLNEDITTSLKLSFRTGGEKMFHERLKSALVQRQWLLTNAPSIPKPNNGTYSTSSDKHAQTRLVGIAGLEHRGQQQRKNNEQMIGNAFEDLEALMVSAKDIVKLAESLSVQTGDSKTDSIISQSVSALGLSTTKDMLGSEALYISELSRNLAEYLLDDSRGILRKEGGVISLVDFWAIFNQARNGVELVSPKDFEKAVRLWETLKLPIKLRQFKSGLLVIQGTDRTDERIIANMLEWLKHFHDVHSFDQENVTWDWSRWGKGVTIEETAKKFKWSIGVATEELEMLEERGILCREQSIDGVRFWKNWFLEDPPPSQTPQFKHTSTSLTGD